MKKLTQYRITIILLVIAFINLYYYGGDVRFIEELDIPSGIGYDIENHLDGINYYAIPIDSYIYTPTGVVKDVIHVGKGETLLKTRQYRQRSSNRKFLLGNEKVYLISEKMANRGIDDLSNLLYFIPNVNPSAVFLVCSGKPEEILKYKINGYPTSSDYIYEIVKNLVQYNFFPKEKYDIKNIYMDLNSEGKNLVLPYIEIKEDGLEITGMGIFKGDKMVTKINSEELQTMNLLRENKTKGIISIINDPDNYAEVDCYVKRKAKCYRENGRYKFIINLKIDGDVINYKSNKYRLSSEKADKELKDNLEKNLHISTEEFISKMQKQYKVDVLGLGNLAASKYGRHSKTNWNKVIMDSEIKVNTDIKIIRKERLEK
ncbi:Ger(x)C family spore germination protein [Clostridium niameyense]|uniref:Ger(X)C family spore germination protein n=1 Tax=Clostridium niameyense TaxID=1622073 RepID=A0A6M0R865_9CLOT|nr:Ger(x)C family spore germination protein [Clostridium niameyense]NEZ45799.1 Ger(x)C family spore germination protein [Clostridium niameyense]